MTRLDCHAPNSFDPAAYSYVGSLYQGPVAHKPSDLENALWAKVEASSYRGNFANKRSCDHCGAHFHYGAVFAHANGDVIVVGHTCADEAFGYATRRDYDKAALESRVAGSREAARKAERTARFLVDHPGLEEALKVEHSIVSDIASRLGHYGELSERQVELVFKLAREVADRKTAEDAEVKVAVVPGRRVITGTVLGTKVQDSVYGSVTKMLVRADDGQKLWGTVPSALFDGSDMPLRGRKVQFSGTVEASGKDPFFGFFSRPAKACFVEA